MGVLGDFPRITEKNQVESSDGFAVYYKQYVKPFLKCLMIDVGASTSSGDDDASYGSDEDEKDRELLKPIHLRRIYSRLLLVKQ